MRSYTAYIERIALGVMLTLSLDFLHAGAHASGIYFEDFEGVALGRSVDEAIPALNVWTETGPAGWSVDDSGVPGAGTPSDGVTEWAGWSWADVDWWSQTAGDQDRSQFASGLAFGTVMVADPDEWDDAYHPDPIGWTYDAFVSTSMINIAGVAPGQLGIEFDSSWLPEGNQLATITVSYNSGAPIEVLRWESDPLSADFHSDAPNESVTIHLSNPSASTAKFTFGLSQAGNNWWWAVDNIQVFNGTPDEDDATLHAQIDRDTGEVLIANRTGGPVAIKGYSLVSQAGSFDETAYTPLADNDSNWIQFTAPGAGTELSEGHATTGTIAAGATINLGNAWLPYVFDESDIEFQYLDGNGDRITRHVTFVGNSGESYQFLDLNFDNVIDIQDWVTFVNVVGTDLTGMTESQLYRAGDLNFDGVHNPLDFLEFRNRYDAVNGPGAFKRLFSIPEPSTFFMFLLVVAILCGMCASAGNLVRSIFNFLGILWLRTGSIFILAIIGILSATNSANAQLTLLFENFEGLPLGPNVEESLAGDEVWTNIPPSGWIKDDTGVPGYNNPPENNGITEWIGWTFTNKEWWTETAGDQRRIEFTNASGTVMVADCDEWDDATHPGSASNPYNAFITSTPISLAPIPVANSVFLSFDSSWRPEYDSWYHQIGTLEISYNGGAFTEILRWESDPASPYFKDDNSTNEKITLPLNNPLGASDVRIRWGLIEAGNDWWWAVDNINVFAPADPLVLEIDNTDGQMRVRGDDVIPSIINSYEIRSAGNSLDPNGWKSFSRQGVDSIGSQPGEHWEELNGAPSQLFEAFLFGSTPLDNQVEILLGNAYNELVDGRDLTFLYTNIFGDVVEGVVVYDVDIPDVTNLADFDGDGDIDGNDFLRWQMSFNQDADGDADGDGDTDRNDLFIWQQQFGSIAGNTSIAIPEPATLVICGLLFFGSVITKLLCLRLQPSPTTAAVTLPIVLALIVIVGAPAMGDTFNDREYQMGDEPGEGAVAGGYVSSTWDSADQPGSGDLQDLFQGGNARYVNTSARPFADGGTELGIQFNGISDFLEGDRLDYPETSTASAAANPPGPVDYYGISKRGFQCWINPASPGNGVAQDVVMDTNNHGVRLSETGNWMMRYINLDYDSGIPAVAGQWYHIELVVPDGESLSAQMYVNGIAVAAAFGDYRNRNQSESLVIGANTGFLSGTENFFAGIVDDLDMFVMGVSAKDFNDYGEFNPGTDNEFIAKTMESIDVADVNANGTVDYDDVDAFVAGWFSKNLINGIPVGDLGSRHNGDLNYDGIVDLADWSILNAANPGIGSAAMACIQGVPEPATIALVSLLLFGSLSCRGLRLL